MSNTAAAQRPGPAPAHPQAVPKPQQAKTSVPRCCTALLLVSAVALGGLAWALGRAMEQFENLANARFFFKYERPFREWAKRTEAELNGRKRGLQVKNCTEIRNFIFDPDIQTPILFKGCIGAHLSLEDFLFFPEHGQNLFPACTSVQRHFTYTTFTGETNDIIEELPCATDSLRSKVDRFHAHDLSSNNGTSNYWEVHTYYTSAKERTEIWDTLHKHMPTVFPDVAISARHVINTAITYFFGAGRTAVYYRHAHMDHFLSFCLQDKKEWDLIDPLYYDYFDSVWSGTAQMMLKERREIPVVKVHQERGDILFVTPWWIHQTRVKKTRKNVGFNIHYCLKGDLVQHVLDFFAENLADPAAMYRLLPWVIPSQAGRAHEGAVPPSRRAWSASQLSTWASSWSSSSSSSSSASATGI